MGFKAGWLYIVLKVKPGEAGKQKCLHCFTSFACRKPRVIMNSEDVMAEDGATGLREACGLFGVVSSGDWPTELNVAHIIYLGLDALQHRGQESAGIVTSRGNDDGKLAVCKGAGLVSSIFAEEQMIKLKGNLGIGHTRYSTTGGTDVANCQPFTANYAGGKFAMAHNGELINHQILRKKILERGVALNTDSDSELITQMLSLNPLNSPNEVEYKSRNWTSRVRYLMSETPAAYSLLIMHNDKIYGVRDLYGNRPLCLGKIVLLRNAANADSEDEAEGWVIASESCAFQTIGASYIRDVQPGEIVELSRNGIKSIATVPRPNDKPPAFCIFEYVYFARPDSKTEGQMVYTVRYQCGVQLAKEAMVAADIVSSIPESATPAALGFAAESGIPFVEVLCKNRYVGRTFIQPSRRLRQLSITKKFGVLEDNVRGKRIILIDDSIVRGNTIAPILRMLKHAGALEVHVRIASPQIRFPCYMGINIPTRDELIANHKDVHQFAIDTG
ncbi:hypothetical protein CHUAL_006686 [Chamberlinius hualienensis]